MIPDVYIFTLMLFLTGGIYIFIISRKMESAEGRKLWLKYLTCFLIFNIIFAVISLRPPLFHYLSILLIFGGYLELIKLFTYSGFSFKGFFIVSISVYSGLAGCFYLFGLMKMELILYTFLIVFAFDVFSNVACGILNKKSLLPEILPGMTIEGISIGALASLASAALLKDLPELILPVSILYAAGILASAFAGTLAASWYKRKYKSREYSKLIPGLGGIIDIFSGLITAGTFIYLLMKFHF